MRQIIVVLFSTLIALPAIADEIVLDLADAGSRSLVAPGTELEFKVKNRLPGSTYRYKIQRSGILPPLDLDAVLPETAVGAETPEARIMCQQFLKDLAGAATEVALRHEFARALAQSPSPACTERIRAYEQATEEPLGTVTLGEDQTVTVTITRTSPKNDWVFEFSSGESKWLIHYGFSFLPDEDHEYFTKELTGEGEEGFVITRTSDPSGAEFEPTIAFSFVPRQDRRAWLPSFTAGLGADIEERLVFAGASWIIGDNVSLFVGAAGHEQTRLKGIYNPEQTIKESLSADQLLEETFDYNAIFGVGFRFNRNPFKKQQTTAASAQESSTGSGSTTESSQTTAPPPQEPAEPQEPTEPAQPPDAVGGRR